MSSHLVPCPKCRATLLEGVFNQLDWVPCPSCGTRLQAEIFPALFRPLTLGREGEAVMIEGESSCFYHPSKKAVIPCEGCGRFLCALCDCELGGQHFCTTCLEAGKSKGKIKNLENHRTLYDSIAFALAFIPVLFAVTFVQGLMYSGMAFTIVTAPIALIIAIRFWNAPRSIVHHTRIRFILAIIFSALQIITWIVLICIAAIG